MILNLCHFCVRCKYGILILLQFSSHCLSALNYRSITLITKVSTKIVVIINIIIIIIIIISNSSSSSSIWIWLNSEKHYLYLEAGYGSKER